MKSITQDVLDSLFEMQEHICFRENLNDSYEKIFHYIETGEDNVLNDIVNNQFQNYSQSLEQSRTLILKAVITNAYLGLNYLKEHNVSLSLREMELLNDFKKETNRKDLFISSLKIICHFEIMYPYFYKTYLADVYDNKAKLALVYQLCPILLNDIIKEKEENDNTALIDLNNLKYGLLSIGNRELEETYGFDKLDLCFREYIECMDDIGYFDFYESEIIDPQKMQTNNNIFYLETTIDSDDTMENLIDEIVEEDDFYEESENEEADKDGEFEIIEDVLFLNFKNTIDKVYKYIMDLNDKHKQEKIIRGLIKRFILGYEIADLDTELGYKYSMYIANNSVSKNLKLFLKDRVFGTMVTSTCLYTQEQLDNLTDIEIQLQQKYETLKKYSDPEVKEKQYEKQGGKFSN